MQSFLLLVCFLTLSFVSLFNELERLLYEGMKEKNRLGEKVVERKNEISDTKRIAHGSGHVGRGGGGSSDMNRRSNPTHHNSATSLLQAVCFWVPNIDLFLASFAIIFIFLFN